MSKRIIRVFPRKTNATPIDELVRINSTPTFFDEADEVHISVTFTWDIPLAKFLEIQWKHVAPVMVGGPAFDNFGGDFTPGMYLKKGYVITSRGCPNRCWFCSVPKREGYQLRELPVTDGWIVTDDNLLACSNEHIDKVFEMLKRQPKRPEFVGGLEARLLTLQMAEKLFDLKPKTMFFAYDTPDDYDPLVEAGKLLEAAGFRRHNNDAKCYVLCGYKGDTFSDAERRMLMAWDAGFFPFAMVYQDVSGKVDRQWKKFQRLWANPYIVSTNLNKL